MTGHVVNKMSRHVVKVSPNNIDSDFTTSMCVIVTVIGNEITDLVSGLAQLLQNVRLGLCDLLNGTFEASYLLF